MIHLHGYSHYSMLQALGNIKDIIQKAEQLDQPAIAITDPNSGFALLEFYEKADKIKPILGVDLNFSYDGEKLMNIVLLAKNYEGYKNIIKLISIANTENYKKFPYVNMDNLKKYSKGIIALSGGNGEIEKLIVGQEPDDLILDKISQYEDIFEGEFRLEFLTYEYNIFPERRKIEEKFKQYIKQNKKKGVITSNYRYINKEDKESYDVLLCIKNNRKYEDSTRPQVKGDFYIMSEDEVKEFMKKNNIDSSLQKYLINSTHEIEQKINCKIPLHQLLFPKYEVPPKYQKLYEKAKNLEI